jgi:uncharacterized protein YjbJ (UPF0337 family)
MNRVELQGKMRQLRGKMKAKWAQLTDDDIALIEAQIEQMIGVLQARYGYAPERARADLEKYLREYNEEAQHLLGRAVERVQDRLEKVKAPSRPLLWGGLAVVVFGLIWMFNRNQNN